MPQRDNAEESVANYFESACRRQEEGRPRSGRETIAHGGSDPPSCGKAVSWRSAFDDVFADDFDFAEGVLLLKAKLLQADKFQEGEEGDDDLGA